MTETVLRAVDLHKTYRARGMGRGTNQTKALAGVSIEIGRGQTLGVVGESGSGKSTLGRVLVGLVTPEQGHLVVNGREIDPARRRWSADLHRDIQMVFQDPYSSLDPTKRIRYTLTEPLVVQRVDRAVDRDARAAELMDAVGLHRKHLDRYPHELSGGQRQRVAVARALMTSPSVIVCDEPVSALDVSTQAQVVNLLRDLQDEMGVSLLFITHDLFVAQNISDRICVMRRGEIVEEGDSDRILRDPEHPYTRALLDAIPGTTLRNVE